MATATKKMESMSKASAASRPFDELGSTGLKRQGLRSNVDEELLRELQGEKGIRTFREMRDNDSVVGACMFAVEMLARNVSWRVEGPNEEFAEFVEQCVGDMTHTWEDLIAEILSMVVYGYSWHEVVYKKRNGDHADTKQRSKYNDGKIGWRKIPIRAQDTLIEWEFDEGGGVQAFVQSAPPDFRLVSIPIERSLLFRTGMHKGNPEGRSILRNAFRPWYFKKKIEESEAIGIERDLAGLPVIYRTDTIAAIYDDELKKILRNVRRNEQEGLLLPLVFHPESGEKELVFELTASGGTRQFDTSDIINRKNREITMTILADFIMLGSTSVGSFAMSESKMKMFGDALGAVLKNIASVFNTYGIPRLLRINGMRVDDENLPAIVPGPILAADLEKLGDFVRNLSQSGAELFPDDDFENHLRDLADLPQRAEREEEMPSLQPQRSTPMLPAGEEAPDESFEEA